MDLQINKEVIEISLSLGQLIRDGLAVGTLSGDCRISFPQTINLDSNTEYQICCRSIVMLNPNFQGSTPRSVNSHFLYLSLVEQSRIGTEAGNLLHKTLPMNVAMYPDVSRFFSKFLTINNNATILDWKTLREKEINTINIKYQDSVGTIYPNTASQFTSGAEQDNLIITLLIRKSPHQKKTGTISLLQSQEV